MVGAAESVPVHEAAGYTGRAVSLEGFVERVVCSPRACLLSFEAGFRGLVAKIPTSDLASFPDPKKTYERHRVRIRGVVEEQGGRLRLELTSPDRIAALDAAGPQQGSRVLAAHRNVPVRTRARTDPPAARTQVRVSGGLADPAAGAGLDSIVRDLQQEAATTGASGEAASGLAVRGLRERVSIQSETIRALEDELGTLQERLQDLEERPAEPPRESSMEGVPHLERWVVPARRGLSDARPRTGWSTDRLVRELGPPVEVSVLSRDRALWLYEDGGAVTVSRGRVVSASGF